MKNKLFLFVLFCLLCMKGFASIIVPSASSPGVCVGSNVALSDVTAGHGGGTWTSSNTAIGSVGSTTGIFLGISTGTTIITYAYSGGSHTVTLTVSVSTGPDPITGDPNVCSGGTTTLACATGSGTWTSNNTGLATVGTSGIVTAGSTITTVPIIYSISNGCKTSVLVTVNQQPAGVPIYQVCVDAQVTATIPTPPAVTGSWSSSNTSVATVTTTSTTTGQITGVSAGTTMITYTTDKGCWSTRVASVHPLPAAITGTQTVCVGATTVLNDASGTGMGWSSSNTAVGTVASSGNNGTVRGISNGTTTITYTMQPIACHATINVTVGPTVAPITGTATVCEGSTTTLSNATAGGTWSSANGSVATVSSGGVVTGVAAGTATISYASTGSCGTAYATIVITVNSSPAGITGTLTICAGLTTTLSDATEGGTWSSGNTDVATVGSSSGIVTGVSAGTAVITYTIGNGCYSKATVTINGTTMPSIECVKQSGPPIVFGIRNNPGYASVVVTYTANIAIIGTTTVNGVSADPLTLNSGTPDIFTAIPIGDINYDTDPYFPTGWSIIGFDVISVGYSGCTWLYDCSVSRPGGGGATLRSTKSGTLSLKPNPNTGTFKLNGVVINNATDKDAQIEVIDLLGNLVYNETVSVENGIINKNITLGNYIANGMYIVKVSCQNTRHVLKLTLQR